MNMKKITIGDKTVEVEIDYFQMLVAGFSEDMTREEIEQFLVDSWVEEI
jgi:hypothetical protein